MKDVVKYGVIVGVALLAIGFMASIAYGVHEEYIFDDKHYDCI